MSARSCKQPKKKQILQNGKASAIFLVPDCRNAHQQIQSRLAAKSHTMGHRSRQGAYAAPKCGQAERGNFGHRQKRMIQLDMGGLLLQESGNDTWPSKHKKTFYLSYSFLPVGRTNPRDLMQIDVHCLVVRLMYPG